MCIPLVCYGGTPFNAYYDIFSFSIEKLFDVSYGFNSEKLLIQLACGVLVVLLEQNQLAVISASLVNGCIAASL